jgi:hypothetical protein
MAADAAEYVGGATPVRCFLLLWNGNATVEFLTCMKNNIVPIVDEISIKSIIVVSLTPLEFSDKSRWVDAEEEKHTVAEKTGRRPIHVIMVVAIVLHILWNRIGSRTNRSSETIPDH